MTVSAYIVRLDQDEPLCLVHMHRKMGKLMQAGGHIELNETPWQSVAHEVSEETGYTLEELKVAQHDGSRAKSLASISHPIPFDMNTHSVGNDHFHSDLCYGFVADGPARSAVASGESADQRWLTLSEMRELVEKGEVLEDMYYIYEKFVRSIGTYALVAAIEFSLDKPTEAIATYKFGAPGE